MLLHLLSAWALATGHQHPPPSLPSRWKAVAASRIARAHTCKYVADGEFLLVSLGNLDTPYAVLSRSGGQRRAVPVGHLMRPIELMPNRTILVLDDEHERLGTLSPATGRASWLPLSRVVAAAAARRGSTLLVAILSDGGARTQLWRCDRAGKKLKLLASASGEGFEVACTPDGAAAALATTSWSRVKECREDRLVRVGADGRRLEHAAPPNAAIRSLTFDRSGVLRFLQVEQATAPFRWAGAMSRPVVDRRLARALGEIEWLAADPRSGEFAVVSGDGSSVLRTSAGGLSNVPLWILRR
jgi:hypothetical protein